MNKFWIFNKEVSKEEWENRFNIGKIKSKDVGKTKIYFLKNKGNRK